MVGLKLEEIIANMSEQSSTQTDWWQSADCFLAIHDYAILLGLIKKCSTNLAVTQIPVTVSPYKFPSDLFFHAMKIQRDINSLIDEISQDFEFISETLKCVIGTDDFTRRLFEIFTQVSKDNKQTCVLGLHRSDYMIDNLDFKDSERDKPIFGLKQVEINTISVSMFSLTQDRIEKLHRYVGSRYLTHDIYNIPENKCLNSLTAGIARAWQEYGDPKACVLIVSQPAEVNMYDIRLIEYLLWETYSIPAVYKTLSKVNQEARLGPKRELILSDQEVAVVYYRSAYSPSSYPSDKEWDARLMLERSRATNCPSVAYQLVGTKKMQQALCMPGVLEKFIRDPVALKNIQSTFAGMYPLDKGPEGDKIVDMALQHPERFVIKPQREGGSNNFFGDEIRPLLKQLGATDERGAYILMDRIQSPSQQGFILNPVSAKIEPHKLVCELGILGVFLRKKQSVLLNDEGGYILRSKLSDVNEGGISAGIGTLDMLTLVSSEEFIRLHSV